MKTVTAYKFLNLVDGKIKSEHGNQTWEIDKEYSVKGIIKPCNNGFHASMLSIDALSYVKGDVFAIVKASGLVVDDDKFASRNMTIIKAYKWTKNDSVALSIFSANLVIKIFEDKYPGDKRPRLAIQSAKKCLKNPTKENAHAADAAAHAAAHAAYEAAAYAAYAAYEAAAYAAADAAAYAADAAYEAAVYAAAYAAADAAADAAYEAAAYAAYAAADAAYEAALLKVKIRIHKWILRRTKVMEEIK